MRLLNGCLILCFAFAFCTLAVCCYRRTASVSAASLSHTHKRGSQTRIDTARNTATHTLDVLKTVVICIPVTAETGSVLRRFASLPFSDPESNSVELLGVSSKTDHFLTQGSVPVCQNSQPQGCSLHLTSDLIIVRYLNQCPLSAPSSAVSTAILFWLWAAKKVQFWFI